MRGLVVFAILALAAGHVEAQPADVPNLIKLVEFQPGDMDRSTWKEKRRDAARKLGQSKDKRATGTLTHLAEEETFDIIGDIAIEGLGNLADPQAVPVLQKIVADPGRDKSSRDLAKKSLAKLGAPESGGGGGSGSATPPTTTTTTTSPTTTTPPTTTTTKTTTTPKTGSGSGSTKTATPPTTEGSGLETGGTVESGETGGTTEGATLLGGTDTNGKGAEVENLPVLADDVIAASERLTFVAGTAGLQLQSLPATMMNPRNTRIDFDGDVAAHYERRMDAETKAYAFGGDAHMVAGYINPSGRGKSRGVLLDVAVNGEARFYAGQIYGVGKVAGAGSMQYIGFTHDTDPNQDFKDSTFAGDFQIALGGGFGRLFDVGSTIRVRRLARVLDDSRALGKPIDAATAKKLQLTWWALRAERSDFRELMATVAILREAGILLGEPNAAITYELLEVLRDTYVFLRPSGFDAQLVVTEGYLKRPLDQNGNCTATCGRIEQVIATAGYGAQLDEDKLELSGDGYMRYRLFADAQTPSPWAIGALARMRRFTYGEHGEQFGMFDLTGEVAVSNDGIPMAMPSSDTSLRIAGELGFTYVINQVSGIRLSANVAEDAGAFVIGARLELTYGLLAGRFAR